MILPIVVEPNPILHAKATSITDITPEIRQLAADMRETMHNAQGLGLAAPQVGQSLALCVLEYENDSDLRDDSFPYTVLINPRITWSSVRKSLDEEACLSIPGAYGNIKRPRAIRVKALNLEGETISFEAEGLFARAIQHELDHLNGVVFTDYLNKSQIGHRESPKYPTV